MASLANTLQNYLEEQIKEDTALASVYDASKINDCAKYIREQARKLQSDGCAVIEDTVVFKWSRDFYYGDTATEKKDENIEVKTATVVTQKKPKEGPKEEPKEELKEEPKEEPKKKNKATKKQKKTKTEKKEEKKEDGFDKYDMCLFADISEEDLWSK